MTSPEEQEQRREELRQALKNSKSDGRRQTKGNNSGGPKQPRPVQTGKIKEKQLHAQKELTTTSDVPMKSDAQKKPTTPKKELNEEEKRIAEIEELIQRPWNEKSFAEIEAAETFLEQGMLPESEEAYKEYRQTVNDFCSNANKLCLLIERKELKQ